MEPAQVAGTVHIEAELVQEPALELVAGIEQVRAQAQVVDTDFGERLIAGIGQEQGLVLVKELAVHTVQGLVLDIVLLLIETALEQVRPLTVRTVMEEEPLRLLVACIEVQKFELPLAAGRKSLEPVF